MSAVNRGLFDYSCADYNVPKPKKLKKNETTPTLEQFQKAEVESVKLRNGMFELGYLNTTKLADVSTDGFYLYQPNFGPSTLVVGSTYTDTILSFLKETRYIINAQQSGMFFKFHLRRGNVTELPLTRMSGFREAVRKGFPEGFNRDGSWKAGYNSLSVDKFLASLVFHKQHLLATLEDNGVDPTEENFTKYLTLLLADKKNILVTGDEVQDIWFKHMAAGIPVAQTMLFTSLAFNFKPSSSMSNISLLSPDAAVFTPVDEVAESSGVPVSWVYATYKDSIKGAFW